MTLADEFTPEPALVEAIVQCIVAGLARVSAEAKVSPTLQWHVRAQHVDTLASPAIPSDWLARLIFRRTYQANRILVLAHIRLAKPHETGFAATVVRGEFDPAVPVESFRVSSYTNEYNTAGFKEWRWEWKK
jgi:hypothetical protein